MTTKAPAPETGPRSEYATAWRTHTCGELRKDHKGRTVTLCGQIDKVLEDKSVVLRDHFGKTLVRIAEDCPVNPYKLDIEVAPESVVKASGTVELRKDPDKALPTGEVVLVAKEFTFVSFSKAPLIYDFNEERLPKTERIRHRYMYLRKPLMHKNLTFRTRLAAALRRFLDKLGFREAETPLLSQAHTPEQAESFYAVRARKEIYTLPGRRAPHGPLLMASGFDRTFELARRFQRKETYGPYQQPEFTVLELMMAFVDEDDLLGMLDAVLAEAGRRGLGAELKPTRITFEEAWARYGSDCPDLRFDLGWKDATDLIASGTKMPEALELTGAGGVIRALRVEGGAAKLEEQDFEELSKLAAGHATALCVFTLGKDGPAPRFIEPDFETVPGFGKHKTTIAATWRVSARSPFERELTKKLCEEAGGREGDVILCILAKSPVLAGSLAGPVRLRAAKALGLLPEAPKEGAQAPDARALRHSLVVVTRLPYYRWDGSEWVVKGDPLTRPVEEELEGDPHRMHGLGFYVVMDGVNIGGGSIRNHDPNTQQSLFEACGYGAIDVDVRFGKLLQALRFGVPPHGRIAIGFDRLVALLLGAPSIDEVIPLPKMPDGSDPLARSPWPVPAGVVRGWLGL